MALIISSCPQDSFTCHRLGNCIPLDLRCDGYFDCPEGDISDEEDCKRVSLDPATYKKEQPPLNRERQRVDINIGIRVFKISNIRELDQQITVKFQLVITWLDGRLTFNNLRDNFALNVIDTDERQKLWLPFLVFQNTKKMSSTIASDDKTNILTVVKERSSSQESLKSLYENKVYMGNQNHMRLSTMYMDDFDCNFQLEMFPFDLQKCPLKIETPLYLGPLLNLQLANVSAFHNIELIQFDFIGFEFPDKDQDETAAIYMKLLRIFKYHLATTYLPTLCLIIIAELTLFIHESHFEATIMVALTTMLVMYTLYQSVSTTLPQTSYLKMIDIWLLMGLILPFIVILILIAIDAWKHFDVVPAKPEVDKAKTLVKIALPILTGIFMVIYWIIALNHYFSNY